MNYKFYSLLMIQLRYEIRELRAETTSHMQKKNVNQKNKAYDIWFIHDKVAVRNTMIWIAPVLVSLEMYNAFI